MQYELADIDAISQILCEKNAVKKLKLKCRKIGDSLKTCQSCKKRTR
ncbi:MAG: hypothetical protein L6V93_07595 [Clostridiales bacterium]|nr:MAG: hypothetical protein L6V93_07595 [Clostridiales bacterium]